MPRPSNLTAEIQDRVLARVRAGVPTEVAVRACGVGVSSHYRWMRERSEYRELVRQARAEAEVKRVAQVTVAARVDWRAAAWFLEREFPERWGPTGRSSTK
jgi:transposase